MKRLLYVITNADLGGAQSHLIDLVAGLKGRFEVAVVCGESGPMTAHLAKIGVDTHIQSSLVRSINPFADALATIQLCRLIRNLNPDLIHAHSSKAGLVARVAALLTRVPCVFTAHGWGFKPGVPQPRRWLVWLSEAVVTALTRKIICVSAYDYQLALKSLPGPRARFVHIANGLADEPSAEVVRAAAPVILIMVARFQEPKDQPALLRAFAKCEEPSTLQLVGTGPTLADCKRLVLELALGERVQFLGERRDVPQLLRGANIFVLASRYEGLPISVLEAMRAGLPVVASRVGGIPELVEHDATGYLVECGDTRALSQALSKLIADPELRARMGAAGKARFGRLFTLDAMLTRTAAVYQSVMGTHSSSHQGERAP